VLLLIIRIFSRMEIMENGGQPRSGLGFIRRLDACCTQKCTHNTHDTVAMYIIEDDGYDAMMIRRSKIRPFQYQEQCFK
jgi:hypothetical protein